MPVTYPAPYQRLWSGDWPTKRAAWRDGAAGARVAHNHQVVGANPTPASNRDRPGNQATGSFAGVSSNGRTTRGRGELWFESMSPDQNEASFHAYPPPRLSPLAILPPSTGQLPARAHAGCASTDAQARTDRAARHRPDRFRCGAMVTRTDSLGGYAGSSPVSGFGSMVRRLGTATQPHSVARVCGGLTDRHLGGGPRYNCNILGLPHGGR